ncbi:hypothetical protein [Lapidilactobacillus gannanensis]|jgi:hypothetical protein|uniref:Uncharacterized protein n=1 Tax=Lapidilactobacillus gannanensis TaxID=2486002 RepID=A0ABW4BQZ0_9LACO|nr:hypothetical protein [Lapidilactobacillus gannanensis]MCH4057455.1 hypothetical protein [Lactobacillaceae bacterium]
MIIWWSILIILAVIVLSWTGHHLWLIHWQHQQQLIVDQQINQAIQVWAAKLPQLTAQTLRSEVPVSIWHRDVLVFEYQVQLASSEKITLTIGEFERYLRASVDLPAEIIVTEYWQLKDTFHFDVAYLRNHATANYVHDMARISHDEAQTKTPTAHPNWQTPTSKSHHPNE